MITATLTFKVGQTTREERQEQKTLCTKFHERLCLEKVERVLVMHKRINGSERQTRTITVIPMSLSKEIRPFSLSFLHFFKKMGGGMYLFAACVLYALPLFFFRLENFTQVQGGI